MGRRMTWRTALMGATLVAAGALAACSSGGGDDGAAGTAADDGSDPTAQTTDTTGTDASTTTAAAAADADGDFLALAYNVAGLPDILSGSNPEANTELIGPLLDGYDLVLLQESWKSPEPNPLAPTRVYHEILEATASHEYKSEMAPQPLGTNPDRPTGLLADGLGFFSNFPLSEVTREAWTGCFGGADTSDNGAGDCLAFKGVALTTVTLPDGTEVDVYNLHAEAGSSDEDQALQRDNFVQLAAFIDAHSAGRPVILGGDTNLHTDEEPDDPQDVEDTTIWEGFLEATGLTDVCAALDCDQPGRIDKFAFRSSDAVRLEPQSWNFETEVFVTDDGESLSDHDALAVRFAWWAEDTP